MLMTVDVWEEPVKDMTLIVCRALMRVLSASFAPVAFILYHLFYCAFSNLCSEENND